MHMDTRHYDRPRTFSPDRFIDLETGDFVKDHKVLMFGVGKRRCPGDMIGRAEVFLIFAAMVQNFELRATGPVDHGIVPGQGFTPVAFEVDFVPRM